MVCIFPLSPSDISCGVNFDRIVAAPDHDFDDENVVERHTHMHTHSDRIWDNSCGDGSVVDEDDRQF